VDPLQGRSVVWANNANKESDSARECKHLLFLVIVLFVGFFLIHYLLHLPPTIHRLSFAYPIRLTVEANLYIFDISSLCNKCKGLVPEKVGEGKVVEHQLTAKYTLYIASSQNNKV